MVTRVRTVFAWGVEEELIPGELLARLKAVRPLEVGELGAREYEEVPPVSPEAFEKTLPYLSAVVRAMVRVEVLTGCRPGEVVRLRPVDLLRGESVRIARGIHLDTKGCWVYLPAQHKTAHRGHRRIILFGPQAQEALRPFLDRDPGAFLFSPKEATAARLAAMRASRKTPVQPSQVSRAKPARSRPPGDCYSVDTYANAILYACRKAKLTKEEYWTPNQLRHFTASALVEQFGEDGWEIARMALGHKSVETTRRYVLDPLKKVVEALRKVG